jgi:putative transposase
MIPQYELKAEDIHQYTMETMKEHIWMEAHGYCCTREMIFDVLFKASAENSSVEATCADLVSVADSNTIRGYLNQAIRMGTFRAHEQQINAALASCIPPAMPRVGIETAIDFHDEPFYGKGAETRGVTVRGLAKRGTTHFVRIATAYVIWRQVRLTLALRFVLPGETALETLQFLLQSLKTLGFSSKVLYLDKGFASTAIVRYLTDQQQPAIIACPIRGKTKGIRALCQGAGSDRTEHTFSDGTQATLALKASLVPDKTGTRRPKWLAFIIICLDWSVEKIYQEYRRRFGIECSYRMVRHVRATTTSRNPALRFFLLGIGLLLLNAWVSLRWEFARLMARGPYRVAEPLFRFHRFTRWLIRAIETIYGTICAIPTHKLPQSVIY